MTHSSDSPHQARKRFGQNFLTDDTVIERIVAAIHPLPDDNIVEIGPGQGALTVPLLEQVTSLQAIELDRDLVTRLRDRFSNNNGFVLHAGDALKFDFSSLAKDKLLRVVGNLPYNISTPLIFHLLQHEQQIQDMHFMLQKEVVERMAATPGSKTYGRLSVAVQYYCDVDMLFIVPPHAFSPAPKVESAIVRLTPRRPKTLIAKDPELLDKLLAQCFQQRRKTLRNTVKPFLGKQQQVSIDLSLRPENLSVADFVQLSNELSGE